MQNSKSHAITQTIHTNLVGLFCDAGYGDLVSIHSQDITVELYVTIDLLPYLHLSPYLYYLLSRLCCEAAGFVVI